MTDTAGVDAARLALEPPDDLRGWLPRCGDIWVVAAKRLSIRWMWLRLWSPGCRWCASLSVHLVVGADVDKRRAVGCEDKDDTVLARETPFMPGSGCRTARWNG